MAENELKWYDIFVVLFGTVLSIADPITDILTLVEFYRTVQYCTVLSTGDTHLSHYVMLIY